MTEIALGPLVVDLPHNRRLYAEASDVRLLDGRALRLVVPLPDDDRAWIYVPLSGFSALVVTTLEYVRSDSVRAYNEEQLALWGLLMPAAYDRYVQRREERAAWTREHPDEIDPRARPGAAPEPEEGAAPARPDAIVRIESLSEDGIARTLEDARRFAELLRPRDEPPPLR